MPKLVHCLIRCDAFPVIFASHFTTDTHTLQCIIEWMIFTSVNIFSVWFFKNLVIRQNTKENEQGVSIKWE